ncbi:hypothetical protein PVAP13_9KG380801 [Panicum virgatum]|uniref:Uncharacterized protein n=1 Tax=Panicum virgatum TaxID=38727 RepID=A0A8T0NP34_PANVG|nr:hypothetical protein PVAP13_9KG380801 [Panicum virgatum]
MASVTGSPSGYLLMKLLSGQRRVFGWPQLQWKNCRPSSWMKLESFPVLCVALSWCSCLFGKKVCVTIFCMVQNVRRPHVFGICLSLKCTNVLSDQQLAPGLLCL